jgi:hypothetical protein
MQGTRGTGADMTAGQGGPSGEPTGRPGDQGHAGGHPDLTKQPGPPGYPQAPPSYPQAPPGYPQGPPGPQGYGPQGYGPQGYGPAPSAPPGWGGQAPQALERPTTARVGIGAFMAYVILGAIAVVVRFSDLDSLVDQALAAARDQGDDVQITRATAHAVVIAIGVIQLVFAALVAMFIWFAWNGRNWARIVLWVIGGIGVLGGLLTLAGGTDSSSGFLSTLSVIQFLLVLGGVVALALKPSNDWYRYRKWARSTGQGR